MRARTQVSSREETKCERRVLIDSFVPIRVGPPQSMLVIEPMMPCALRLFSMCSKCNGDRFWD